MASSKSASVTTQRKVGPKRLGVDMCMRGCADVEYSASGFQQTVLGRYSSALQCLPMGTRRFEHKHDDDNDGDGGDLMVMI